ncbi:pentatricopeptide repeat-containing protein At2g33680 isoform X1 [Dendrobium catenatum]|uniref:pentatricopeptide repeat-containing protein At2g33680 isoform X1 n=1 Tax=Dendrobium catenatum TaxID=906689 RepID=UPI0010A04A15|nr:pentatricopeptide repeat-containing protein At2g33680 isoform X1 [Dendrobium catenatum]
MPDPKLVSWTRTISSYIKSGHADLGLREFRRMCDSGLRPNEYGLSLALKASRLAGEPAIGKLLHGLAIKAGFEANSFCGTSILDMYCKYGYMKEAQLFFDRTTVKCQALWNSFIDGYSRHSKPQEAVKLFHQMLLSCTAPNCFTYTILIKHGAGNFDISFVKVIHARVIKIGFENDCFVGCALIDAFAKFSELTDACSLFYEMEERDHVVWCALIAGLQQSGEAEQALDLYLDFVSEVELGLQLHSCLLKSGFVLDSFIGCALIDMYVSFGMTRDAYGSFVGTAEKNGVIYSTMIQGFVCDSDFVAAVDMALVMGKLGMVFDHSTLSSMLRAFASLDMLEEARVIHCRIVKTIGTQDLIMGNNLMEMYLNFRAIDEAFKMFMDIEVPNEFSWTSLMHGYVESERYDEAFELYRMMLPLGSAKPNEYTIVAALQACSGLPETCQGKQIHGFTIKMGFCLHAFVESALLGMYAKHGCMDDASLIFLNLLEKDIVCWNIMIASYAQHGLGEKALKTFLQYKEGPSNIDESIFSSCLSACSSLTSIDMGRYIHENCVKTGYDSKLKVGVAIIDMYCKCGSIKDARQFFNEMKEHNVISYTAMISGFSQHGLVLNALHLFEVMKESGVMPDGITFVEILSACSHFGLVKEGWEYFESITDYGLEKTMNHYACMVDLLGRVGLVEKAEDLINNAPFPLKTSLWRTLLGACNKHGDVKNGGRIAEIIYRSEPNDTSSYVMLSNLFSSNSMWDHSLEVKGKMKQEFMKKIPGYSWIA